MELMSSIVGLFEAFPWDAALQVVGGLSVIAALTPSKLDDRLFGALTPLCNVILRFKELGAFNFAQAKNADDRSHPSRGPEGKAS